MKANAFRLLIASVVFGSALPLFADCTVTCTATVPSAGTAGVAVDFESTASPCLCSGAASYFWEFGDGADSTDANPSHTYSSNGTYNWELTVTADSTICTKSGSITIGSVTPPAGTYGGTTSLGHAFSLTVNGSSQITAWSISYSALCGGSGTTNVTGANCAVTNGAFSCNTASCSPFSTQTSISGTFASATSVSGNATLKTMPDAINCCTQEPAFTATISPAPLTAGASGDVTTGTAPLTVNFTGSASGGTPPYSYSWDFGDCSAADTAQNPSHVYSAGNYDVVLTVTDSASATAEAVVPVTALSPPGTFVVTSTNPATNAKAASRTANVQATANAVVNVSTVDQTTFLLQGNQTGRIAGTFSAAGNTFEFDPTDAFKPGELVKVSATSGIESTAPATLTPHVWQFTAATNTANGAMSAHPIAPEFGDGWSSDVTLGDLDGDGDLDAVVANEENAADPETVWLNDGTGTFTAHPAISSFGESQSQAVALGDLDGDGDLDAVVANRQPPNAETVWVNDGGGGFTAHPATPTFGGGESMDLALGDLDGDGDLDAVIANHSGQETVWLNDGAGTFIAHPTTPAFGATIFPANTGFAVGLADLDGDGDLDAVIAHDGPETVWLNDGAGNFTAHATPSFGGDYSNDIAVGDVNGDGYADVVVANDITSETVWLNDGTGIFTQHPTAFSAGSGSTAAVALGDVDGDGDLDAVFALFGHPESIWVNDGSGTFTAHTTFGPLGGGTYSVALGDVDGDGDLDAVLASTGDLAETVWLNYDAEDALAGVNVTPAAVSVSETGTTASFDVVLTYAPMRDVTVNIASGDTGEATVSHSSLTFTPADWSVVRTVTVTGIDDALDDGDGSTTVTLTLTTIDPVYFSIDPADVTVTTLDDEELNVVSVAPAPNTKAAPRNTNVQVTADDTINAATVTAAMFRVQSMQSGRIDGAYSASGTTFQLDPTDDLRPGETVHVSATNGVQSSAAVGLTPYVWQFTAATGAASGALEAHPVAMSAGGNTSDAALGDLDGDGDLDAVVVYNNLPATARLNDGTGDFTTVGDTFDGGDSEAVALGDIDGDGDLDAVIGKWSAAGTVWVNDGSGDFSAHSGTPNLDGDYVWDLVLGDLDGDGDLDAVVITGDNAADKVYLNDGAGNFATHPTAATFGATDGRAGALGDLDADGDLDLLIATTQQGEKVWLNDGTGAFTPHPSTPSFGSEYSLGMALGDIDGDGDLDAIFANAVPLEETVWVNDGTGAFTAHSTATFSDNYSFAVALGDLDGDGDFDAIVGHYSGDPAGIWRNDGSGVFSEHPGGATIAAGAIQAIALGDVEGDGDLDALMASNSPSIWLNRPVPGVTVTPTSGLVTTEAGGTATFTVVLDTRPVADVSIEVSSSDTSEGRVSSDGVTQQDSVALTFTTSNWSTPQTVTVHGRNDSLDDGDVAYTLATGAAASTDALYSGFDADDVAAANSDDDTASVTVDPAAVTVAESGTTDTFTVVLDVEPAGDVVIT
ncbi:MAG TPA: FG-GAP-like repeat-containing protein, partial [Thermoanaerobaculia bacterium]|nr:FG-GAP-like repeat-containing protein [Thermoanaerobaculia bacterium]